MDQRVAHPRTSRASGRPTDVTPLSRTWEFQPGSVDADVLLHHGDPRLDGRGSSFGPQSPATRAGPAGRPAGPRSRTPAQRHLREAPVSRGHRSSSGVPPTAVATTARPAAIASITALLIPSCSEGRTTRSARASSGPTSSQAPRKRTSSRSSSAWRSSAARTSPSPASTNVQGVPRTRSSAVASSRYRCPLYFRGWRRTAAQDARSRCGRAGRQRMRRGEARCISLRSSPPGPVPFPGCPSRQHGRSR